MSNYTTDDLKDDLKKMGVSAVGYCAAAATLFSIFAACMIGISAQVNGWDKTMFNYGLKRSISKIGEDAYRIVYRSKKLGNLIFTSSYGQTNNRVLTIEKTLDGELDPRKKIVLEDSRSDGIVDLIVDASGSYQRPNHPGQNPNLEKRFAKADRLFSSLTSEGELADLIKKADAEWKRKYGPLNSDPLDISF